MVLDVPLFVLDREVRGAFRELRRGTRALLRDGPDAEGAALDIPRRVSTRATYEALADHRDPLSIPLRPWVARLTLARVLFPDHARLARAWTTPYIQLERPEPEEVSPRALLRRVLAETSEGRRALFARALALGAGAVSEAARMLAERRAEATALLRATEADLKQIPCDPKESVGALAEELLRGTEGLLPTDERWHETLVEGLGRDAAEGWPGKLTTRWIDDLFRATGLLQGVTLDAGPLPMALGGTSFTRALATFGAAFAEATLADGAPFVLARKPYDLRVARRSSLFASLTFDPVFFARALNLGRARARTQARLMTRALVRSIRIDAARVLLRDVAFEEPRSAARRFEEVTARALGVPLPVSLLGALPALAPGDATRLMGHALAALDRLRLMHDYDDDWFRSPHAARALREEQAVLPAAAETTRDELERGGRALLEGLRQQLE